jgi:nucleotide-binding universal stress UspA family protein
MFPIAKILLPVDFSERAGHAARFAVPVAEHFHSQVTVLHVLPPPYEVGSGEAGFAMQAELVAARRQQAQEQLDGFLTAELGHLQVRRVLREGDPAREIVDCARTESASLVVMPTHGYGRFRRLLLGSVTAKVLHDLDGPVWTTAHAESLPGPAAVRFQHVLCAVDLEQGSRRVLDWSTGFAAEFGARVTLVHAMTGLDPRTVGYQFSPEWRDFVVGAAEQQITTLQQQAGTHVEVKLAEGPVAEMVCDAVEELSADLLVIGRGSNAGMLGRLTSQAYAIIRQSPCPVVSV